MTPTVEERLLGALIKLRDEVKYARDNEYIYTQKRLRGIVSPDYFVQKYLGDALDEANAELRSIQPLLDPSIAWRCK